jgi:hypothetical protein
MPSRRAVPGPPAAAVYSVNRSSNLDCIPRRAVATASPNACVSSVWSCPLRRPSRDAAVVRLLGRNPRIAAMRVNYGLGVAARQSTRPAAVSTNRRIPILSAATSVSEALFFNELWQTVEFAVSSDNGVSSDVASEAKSLFSVSNGSDRSDDRSPSLSSTVMSINRVRAFSLARRCMILMALAKEGGADATC